MDCGHKFEFLPSISNVTFRIAFYGSKYIKDFKPNLEVDCGQKFEFLPSISNVTFRSAFLSKCHAFDRRCALKPNSVPLLFKPKLSIFWIISFSFLSQQKYTRNCNNFFQQWICFRFSLKFLPKNKLSNTNLMYLRAKKSRLMLHVSQKKVWNKSFFFFRKNVSKTCS